jgi:hypothetical protein
MVCSAAGSIRFSPEPAAEPELPDDLEGVAAVCVDRVRAVEQPAIRKATTARKLAA